MNYNNRKFRGKKNSENGQVSQNTVFLYFQDENRLWGRYSGGEIKIGQILGKVHADGSIDFLYQHENLSGELVAGKCHSVPHRGENGRIVLKESWQWFTGDQSLGHSEVEEIID